jgi:NhaC family Na+:H+ antiporter
VLATNIVTADQYMAVVLPARMFKKAIAERGLAPVVLSRAAGASGMPTSALIPWNSCGAYYMAATLGRRHAQLLALRGVQSRARC